MRVATMLHLALGLLATANLGRIPLLSAGGKDAPLLLSDLGVIALVLAGAFSMLQRRSLVLDRPALFAVAFASVGGLSALLAVPRFGLSAFQFVFSIAYLIRWGLYFTVYVVVINCLSRSDVPTIWRTLERVIVAFAGFGIVQAIFLPGFAQMVYPDAALYQDWDPQGHRLVSTFLDPNFAGALIAIGLLVLLARLAFGIREPYWKLVLLFAALCMTVSRSSILALLAGTMVILAVRGKSARLWKFGLALIALLLPALPVLIPFASSFGKFSMGGSAFARVVAWLTALEILADHPIIGIGFNTYGFVQAAYGYTAEGNASFGADGGLLFIAVMTGLVGLSLYCGMLLSVLLRARRVWNDATRAAEERALAVGVAAATCALVVHSIFLNSLLYPNLMVVLWVLWGMVSLAMRSAGPHQNRWRGPSSSWTRVVQPRATRSRG